MTVALFPEGYGQNPSYETKKQQNSEKRIMDYCL